LNKQIIATKYPENLPENRGILRDCTYCIVAVKSLSLYTPSVTIYITILLLLT
jgi:hypothetical protein